jgi:lipopolysaccharide export system permease protein
MQLRGDGSRVLGDREMTLGELRQAALQARRAAGTAAAATGYEVEIQKKFALAAACAVLALVGAAAAIRFPRGGVAMVIGASAIVFPGYYLSMTNAERLAERQVIAPSVAMWAANGLLLAVALILVSRAGRPDPDGSRGRLATNG